MTINYNYTEKISQLLANESTDTDWHIDLGTGTDSPTVNDTALSGSLGKVEATFSYSGATGTFEGEVKSTNTTYMGESITEIGVYDSSSGDLQSRNIWSTGMPIDTTKNYRFRSNVVFSNSFNTSLLKITEKSWENIYELMAEEDSTYPTHVAFSTHLIFDTFNATSGWSATNGAVATNTNRQEGTNSVSLSKTGTGSTSVYMSKTPTAIDASDVTTIRLWVRVASSTTLNKLASTNCMEIRYGSGSGDYKSIQLDRSDLDTVWTLLELDVGDFSDTGSPTTSAIDYLYIGFTSTANSDTWSAGEILLDMYSASWDIDATDNTLHEEVVRKAISTIELDGPTVKYSGNLGTSEGNTYNYYYVGLFDDASSGDMYLVNQLYLTEKNSNKQINFFIEIGVRLV